MTGSLGFKPKGGILLQPTKPTPNPAYLDNQPKRGILLQPTGQHRTPPISYLHNQPRCRFCLCLSLQQLLQNLDTSFNGVMAILPTTKWFSRRLASLSSHPLRVCVVGSGPAGFYTAEKVYSSSMFCICFSFGLISRNLPISLLSDLTNDNSNFLG